MTTSTYDKRPVVGVGPAEVRAGVEAVRAALRGPRVVAVETYPGVRTCDVTPLLSADLVVDVAEAYLDAATLDALVAPDLTDDPVFGRLTSFGVADFFDPARLAALRDRVAASTGTVALHGTGASLIAPYDLLVYADLARWEIQQRQRAGDLGNLGADNAGERASLLYKRAFFLDWRAADRLKATLLDRVDLFLDTTTDRPLLVPGADVRRGLELAGPLPLLDLPSREVGVDEQVVRRDERGAGAVQRDGPGAGGHPLTKRGQSHRVEEVLHAERRQPAEHRVVGEVRRDHRVECRRVAVGLGDVDDEVRGQQWRDVTRAHARVALHRDDARTAQGRAHRLDAREDLRGTDLHDRSLVVRRGPHAIAASPIRAAASPCLAARTDTR